MLRLAFTLLIVSITQDTSNVCPSVQAIILRENKSIILTSQIDKVIGRPDICDITVPYRIWAIRSELFIQDILKFIAEIGIYGSSYPWFHPLGFDPHFLHIFSNGTF